MRGQAGRPHVSSKGKPLALTWLVENVQYVHVPPL